jgi:hypothetical protein
MRYCHPQAEAIERAFTKLDVGPLHFPLQFEMPLLKQNQPVIATSLIQRG